MLKLYSYFRSSAAYRVRIALNLKGVEFETVPVNLLKAENNDAAYLGINPQGLVPTLSDGDVTLSQSLAILDYLDEKHPEPALIFGTPEEKALIRQLALVVACEIHPLNNLGVLKYIQGELGASDEQKMQWYAHWGHKGLRAMEATLERNDWQGPYCVGSQISLADICLIPQLYNMRRFDLIPGDCTRLLTIEENCNKLDAFIAAAPENQPDTPEELRTASG